MHHEDDESIVFKKTFGQTDYLFAQYRLQMSVLFSRTGLCQALAGSVVLSQYIYIVSILYVCLLPRLSPGLL